MTTPGGALIVARAKDGSRRWYWEATWRHEGQLHKRRLGEAWIRPRATPADVKGWGARYEKRPGNPPSDELTPQQATVAMRDLIVAYAAAAPVAGPPRTFRQAANTWLDDPHARSHSWTPETYAFNRGLLAEPGDDQAPRPHTPRVWRPGASTGSASTTCAHTCAVLTGKWRRGPSTRTGRCS